MGYFIIYLYNWFCIAPLCTRREHIIYFFFFIFSFLLCIFIIMTGSTTISDTSHFKVYAMDDEPGGQTQRDINVNQRRNQLNHWIYNHQNPYISFPLLLVFLDIGETIATIFPGSVNYEVVRNLNEINIKTPGYDRILAIDNIHQNLVNRGLSHVAIPFLQEVNNSFTEEYVRNSTPEHYRYLIESSLINKYHSVIEKYNCEDINFLRDMKFEDTNKLDMLTANINCGYYLPINYIENFVSFVDVPLLCELDFRILSMHKMMLCSELDDGVIKNIVNKDLSRYNDMIKSYVKEDYCPTLRQRYDIVNSLRVHYSQMDDQTFISNYRNEYKKYYAIKNYQYLPLPFYDRTLYQQLMGVENHQHSSPQFYDRTLYRQLIEERLNNLNNKEEIIQICTEYFKSNGCLKFNYNNFKYKNDVCLFQLSNFITDFIEISTNNHNLNSLDYFMKKADHNSITTGLTKRYMDDLFTIEGIKNVLELKKPLTSEEVKRIQSEKSEIFYLYHDIEKELNEFKEQFNRSYYDVIKRKEFEKNLENEQFSSSKVENNLSSEKCIKVE